MKEGGRRFYLPMFSVSSFASRCVTLAVHLQRLSAGRFPLVLRSHASNGSRRRYPGETASSCVRGERRLLRDAVASLRAIARVKDCPLLPPLPTAPAFSRSAVNDQHLASELSSCDN